MGRYTTRLFARPSHFYGLVHTLDVRATFDSYVLSDTSEAADLAAMTANFHAVAEDFCRVLRPLHPSDA